MAELPTGGTGPQSGIARPSSSPTESPRAVRLVVSRESDETAWRAACREVLRHLESRAAVPPAVREMLEENWARALARVRQREGAGSAAWSSMLKAMDDLLWSIEPKTSPDDRKRLMLLLPALIAELQEGMIQGQWSSDRRDLFFSALVDCHANAVKAGLKRPNRIVPV